MCAAAASLRGNLHVCCFQSACDCVSWSPAVCRLHVPARRPLRNGQCLTVHYCELSRCSASHPCLVVCHHAAVFSASRRSRLCMQREDVQRAVLFVQHAAGAALPGPCGHQLYQLCDPQQGAPPVCVLNAQACVRAAPTCARFAAPSADTAPRSSALGTLCARAASEYARVTHAPTSRPPRRRAVD